MGSLTHQSQSVAAKGSPAIGTSGVSARRGTSSRSGPLTGAFAALVMFMVIYFARPEEWIPGFSTAPLAKIAGILVLLALIFSLRQIRQRFPRVAIFVALLVGQLFLSSALSPVWRGGAFQLTLNFAKVLMVVLVVTATVTTVGRLRVLIFTQAVSLAAIAVAVIWKGRLILGRLEGIFGGTYSDPNDLALSIIMSLPLCLVLLFLSKSWRSKILWSTSILVMTYAVLRTGSRGGFLALVVVAAICLWEFAIRGRRPYLLGLAILTGLLLWQSAGGLLVGRLKGTLNVNDDTAAAYASAQTRQQLFWRSVEVTKEHPLFGVGPGNFDQVSGQWHTTHNSFTLISAEGGLPALVLYVSILLCGFRNLRATMRLTPRRTESRLLAGALFASLAGYAVGSFFLSVAYAFSPYILVAYTTALLSIARKSAAQAREIETARQETLEKQFCSPTPESEISFFPSEILSAPRTPNP
jgi:putative inorganic carbon (hco3(-)) transporter